MKPEQQLAMQVSQYLSLQYPDAIYRFDLAADMKLTMGQAARNKRLNTKRGYPDLFIAKCTPQVHGLFIELKAEGNSPFKKDGTLKKDQHLEEQQAMIDKLWQAGYAAHFATGFDEVKRIIDHHMKGVAWDVPKNSESNTSTNETQDSALIF